MYGVSLLSLFPIFSFILFYNEFTCFVVRSFLSYFPFFPSFHTFHTSILPLCHYSLSFHYRTISLTPSFSLDSYWNHRRAPSVLSVGGMTFVSSSLVVASFYSSFYFFLLRLFLLCFLYLRGPSVAPSVSLFHVHCLSHCSRSIADLPFYVLS
jgi:hypothetical protein